MKTHVMILLLISFSVHAAAQDSKQPLEVPRQQLEKSYRDKIKNADACLAPGAKCEEPFIEDINKHFGVYVIKGANHLKELVDNVFKSFPTR